MSVFGTIKAKTRGSLGEVESNKCYMKLTVSGSDVTGSIENENPNITPPKYVLRIKFGIMVSGICQCKECEEYDPDPPGPEDGDDSSMEWPEEGSYGFCSPAPGILTGGVLAGGFTFIKCVETPDNCIYPWICEGEFGPVKADKEITIDLGERSRRFCDMFAYISGQIQRNLESQIENEAEQHENMFRCNEEDPPKEHIVYTGTPFLGGIVVQFRPHDLL
tara:strand:- start:3504 stop:4163 length:660 start_codon:yes stop_codon:yes gene_type:complete